MLETPQRQGPGSTIERTDWILIMVDCLFPTTSSGLNVDFIDLTSYFFSFRIYKGFDFLRRGALLMSQLLIDAVMVSISPRD